MKPLRCVSLYLCLMNAWSQAALPLFAQDEPACGIVIAYSGMQHGNLDLYMLKHSPDGEPLTNPEQSFQFTFSQPGEGMPVWSADAKQLAFVTGLPFKPRIILMRLDTLENVALTEGQFEAELAPDWSPDGSQVVYDFRDGESVDIAITDIETGETTRLTESDTVELYATWSPDGQHIAFSSDQDGGTDIFILNLDDLSMQNLTEDELVEAALDWSPDGSQIVYVGLGNLGTQLYTVDVATGKTKALTYMLAEVAAPRWSPDSRQVVFMARLPGETGDWDLYMLDVESRDVRQLTDFEGDEMFPAWRPCVEAELIPGFNNP
jgi:Tol biopolymer transport system component